MTIPIVFEFPLTAVRMDAIADDDDDAIDVVSTIKYLLYCYIIIYECLILRMNELHIVLDERQKRI
jgi:hypothetical protein